MVYLIQPDGRFRKGIKWRDERQYVLQLRPEAEKVQCRNVLTCSDDEQIFRLFESDRISWLNR